MDGRYAGPHGIGRFAKEVVDRLPDVRVIQSGGRLNRAADPLWLSYQVARRAPAVFVTPSFVVPMISSVPVVPTIHDLIHLQVEGESGSLRQMYYQRVLRPRVRKAPLVFTVSEFSKMALLEWVPIQEERVVVVGNGVGSPFEASGPATKLNAPFVLMVGVGRPHKNGLRALIAFARSRASRDHLLCIRDRPHPFFVDAARDLGIEEKLVFVDVVDDLELASLYRGAACLLMPSLVEGFGLPALEALACGTRVVGSADTAIEEIVGDAAVLTEPEDASAIAAALDEVIENPDPAAIARGLTTAAKFSWDAVGNRVRTHLERL